MERNRLTRKLEKHKIRELLESQICFKVINVIQASQKSVNHFKQHLSRNSLQYQWTTEPKATPLENEMFFNYNSKIC